MPKSDRKHFEDYRKQTQIKHDILTSYLTAFYHILKGRHKNLVFIDGFAGRGTYTKSETGETFKGSPLLALQLIADTEDFATQVTPIFIESDKILFQQLKTHVDAFYEKHPRIRKPICLEGTFSDRVQQILSNIPGILAPTFLFVDPCGVSGASFQTIRAVMEFAKCETFIFFNIDGIRRIAGLPEVSPVLVELMGTLERAQAVHAELRLAAELHESD